MCKADHPAEAHAFYKLALVIGRVAAWLCVFAQALQRMADSAA